VCSKEYWPLTEHNMLLFDKQNLGNPVGYRMYFNAMKSFADWVPVLEDIHAAQTGHTYFTTY
jgi:hypothetical protein